VVRIDDVSQYEGRNGNTKFTFTVTLDSPSTQSVSVKYATANGTATTSNSDYYATSGTLTFAPGETSKTITVLVKGDKKKESDETFYVNLFDPVNVLLDDAQGIGTIRNDD
jgi:Calx-beta domain-containing protein